MGRISTAAVNDLLTNYAYGLAQDTTQALANFIAPEVECPSGYGHFKAYNDKNAFLVQATDRAIGGPANRITFAASDSTYNCMPQALEITIDDAEREKATGGASLDEAKIRTLISQCIISHENKVMAIAAAGVTAVASRGNWSDADVSPIDQLDEQIEAIGTAVGMLPNRILIGIGAWRKLKNHPKVLSRANVTKDQGVAFEAMLGMLLNPAMQGRIGVLSKDSTKLGGTKSATNIVGSEVYIFIGQDAPSEYDPSFMKTFRTRAGGVDVVRTYREETNRSDVHAVDWSEDVQITGSACVRRLTIT